MTAETTTVSLDATDAALGAGLGGLGLALLSCWPAPCWSSGRAAALRGGLRRPGPGSPGIPGR